MSPPGVRLSRRSGKCGIFNLTLISGSNKSCGSKKPLLTGGNSEQEQALRGPWWGLEPLPIDASTDPITTTDLCSQPGQSSISTTKGAAFRRQGRTTLLECGRNEELGFSRRRCGERWNHGNQQLPSTHVRTCGSCQRPRNLRLREYRTHVEANMRLCAASCV